MQLKGTICCSPRIREGVKAEVKEAGCEREGALLEHPVGPSRRPPYKEDGVQRLLVRSVGKYASVGAHARRSAERKGTAPRRMLRAPIRD